MAHDFLRFKLVAAILSATLPLCGCGFLKLNNDGPSDWSSTYWAVVETLPASGSTLDASKDLARLKSYYQALQNVAGVTDLAQQYIGCPECDQLSTGTPPTKLKFLFYREHLDNMHAFTIAMKRVQASPLADPNFVLTYNTEPPPVDDCPATCKPKAVCFRGCDGIGATPKCDPCP